MQIKFIVLGAAVVFAACLNATVVFADGPQYVGSSSSTLLGNQGYFAGHDACADAFRGSTMCTSQMIIEGGPSSKAPSPGADGEWVNPVFVVVDDESITDFSGIEKLHAVELNCEGWTNDTDTETGLQVQTLGGKVKFFTPTCDIARPVACCK